MLPVEPVTTVEPGRSDVFPQENYKTESGLRLTARKFVKLIKSQQCHARLISQFASGDQIHSGRQDSYIEKRVDLDI